ncbi:MAG: hypothetical protein ACPG49_00345 [Chitinophagales bacterium]
MSRELFDAIDETYTKKEIEQGLKFFIFDFLRKQKYFCLKEGVDSSIYRNIARGNISKKKLIEACCIPFSKKTIFEVFRKFLPSNIRILMEELTWIDILSEDEIEDKFGVKIMDNTEEDRSYYNTLKLKTQYHFFAAKRIGWRGPYCLFLPPAFREILAALYGKPKNSEFHVVELGQTDFVYEQAEKSIFLELLRLKAFFGQGNIRLTKDGRPMLNSLGKMQKGLDLREFFEGTKDKVLKNIRTNAIAGLLIESGSFLYIKEKPLFIKKLFNSYQNQFKQNLSTLLTTVKGIEKINSYHLKFIEKNFWNLLRELPLGKWVTYQNIEDFIKYKMWETAPLTRVLAAENLYFNKRVSDSYSDKYYIKASIFHKAISVPFIKANFFLFAAYGLVEIAYNAPNTSKIVDTYFSPYDGLQYVKLTELGAYVSSEYRTYTPPKESQTRPLVLSEDSLMILSDKNDTTAPILLQNFTQRVGANRYQTDAATFLKDCQHANQIEEKIDLFRQTISSKFPQNWETFFEGLLQNINPFKNVSEEYILLQLPTDNRNLIQLIAQDSVLKKYVLKGEQFHIFVSKSNLSKFKTRLKEFGIFLS